MWKRRREPAPLPEPPYIRFPPNSYMKNVTIRTVDNVLMIEGDGFDIHGVEIHEGTILATKDSVITDTIIYHTNATWKKMNSGLCVPLQLEEDFED